MYADLNEDKTEIVKRYGVGRNPKHTSFSVNSTHEDYVSHGYYLIIDDIPDIPNGKKLGDRTFTVDEAAKTVDISRLVVDAPPTPKVATVNSLIDLLESKGTLTPSDVAELRSV